MPRRLINPSHDVAKPTNPLNTPSGEKENFKKPHLGWESYSDTSLYTLHRGAQTLNSHKPTIFGLDRGTPETGGRTGSMLFFSLRLKTHYN